jgi:hypothetical protein
MKKARLLSIAFIPLLAACVSTNVDLPRDHPANPAAPVAPVALTPALVATPPGAEAPAPVGHQHGHDQHGGHDHQAPKPAPSASTQNAAARPLSSAGATKQADKPPAEVWSCPMHPEVVKSGPGQCPICGMNLVKRAPGKAK